MPSQTYGDISFGTTAQTGIHIDSATFDFSSQEVWTTNADGDDIAGAVFKQEGTFSLEGADDTGNANAFDLGIAITVASEPTLTEWIPGYTSGSLSIVTSGNVSESSETLRMVSVSGVIKPFMGTFNS